MFYSLFMPLQFSFAVISHNISLRKQLNESKSLKSGFNNNSDSLGNNWMSLRLHHNSISIMILWEMTHWITKSKRSHSLTQLWFFKKWLTESQNSLGVLTFTLLWFESILSVQVRNIERITLLNIIRINYHQFLNISQSIDRKSVV